MKIVVIGGTGLIGTKLVANLTRLGHEAVPASPNTGVDTLTGAGLAEALEGAQVVVDVSNSPSFEDKAVLEFFRTSTTQLLAAEATAGVRHHVALSVVGAQRLVGSGYMRAKVVQEELIAKSPIPFSIVHATQFYEFIKGIAQGATEGGTVRLTHALVRPIAADEVAEVLAEVAVGDPLSGTIEIAGPDEIPLDELVRTVLAAEGDPREVVADPHAGYFGAQVEERSLVPDEGARIAATTYAQWREGA